MRLEIIKIVDRGVDTKELVWLKVLADTDLVNYIIFDTEYLEPNAISEVPKNTYWFQSKYVKAGDYIILYTGIGIPSESKNADGSTNHFLYWGNNATIWNKKTDCAVLFEINSWQTSLMGN